MLVIEPLISVLNLPFYIFFYFILFSGPSKKKKGEIFFFCLQIINSHEHLTKPVPF